MLALASPDTSEDTDTQKEADPYTLLEGYYTAETVVTPENDCSADFSYMEGRDLRLWVRSETQIEIEGIDLNRDENTLSGTEKETRDWSSIGADCVTDIVTEHTGEVLEDGRFQWDWEVTWSYVSGDGCEEALESPLPCTYLGLFTMQYDRPLE